MEPPGPPPTAVTRDKSGRGRHVRKHVYIVNESACAGWRSGSHFFSDEDQTWHGLGSQLGDLMADVCMLASDRGREKGAPVLGHGDRVP